ncbi:hypothetical protein TorRG33x02_259060 [Trema orientale]|uniref:Uncharacterized protein n=1 Tax=Trema orientale TaxID=63057 RepID=A0A2P5D848_TREOI|nr:hypothetical protein TorRG33x02_259060 [Trema orientale]
MLRLCHQYCLTFMHALSVVDLNPIFGFQKRDACRSSPSINPTILLADITNTKGKVVISNETTPQKQDLSIRLWTLVTLLVESSNGINREVVLLKPRLLTRRRLQSNPAKHHESYQLECVRLGESP